jgi:serine/threonine-protein kinase
MNHTLKNQACKIPEGTVISGKWHGARYKILQTLGFGATGYVYLANSKNGLVALKISDNSMAITSEVNVLRHFSKVQGDTLGPSLLDVDDWARKDTRETIPFYVMEYMKGNDFLDFLRQNGREWFSVFILQLLKDLDRLHEAGWVFGDLKPENLLIVGPPPKVRWLDVGGTTIIGRSIKEFTEFFDRGYWGLGSRRAEPSYDLFSVAMIMINVFYPNRFTKREGNTYDQLIHVIHEKPELKLYKPVLSYALSGKYDRAKEMHNDILNVIKNRRVKSAPQKTDKLMKAKATSTPASKPKKATKGVLETALIGVLLFLGYLLYLYGQLV